jgi:hypothetical protein
MGRGRAKHALPRKGHSRVDEWSNPPDYDRGLLGTAGARVERSAEDKDTDAVHTDETRGRFDSGPSSEKRENNVKKGWIVKELVDIQGCCVDKVCNNDTCMRLPDGVTCGDCALLAECSWVGVRTDWKVCDFYPRRFRKTEMPDVRRALMNLLDAICKRGDGPNLEQSWQDACWLAGRYCDPYISYLTSGAGVGGWPTAPGNSPERARRSGARG